MAYRANLSGNQQLIVANPGTQTSITLISSSPGQQQSQSNSFTTGNWTSIPLLYQIESGFILQINSDRSQQFISIQANQISLVTTPILNNAIQIDLEKTADTVANQKKVEFEPIPPMKPMQPMQPMKMGNMSMDINTMSMQMGDMSLSMEKQTATPTKRFCTQCGEKVKTSDRFCGSCGNQLDN